MLLVRCLASSPTAIVSASLYSQVQRLTIHGHDSSLSHNHWAGPSLVLSLEPREVMPAGVYNVKRAVYRPVGAYWELQMSNCTVTRCVTTASLVRISCMA
jgi:hypothetical protein